MSGAAVALIVDGFSTGRFLAPEFLRRGVRCVHVRSSPTGLPDELVRQHRPEHYLRNLVHDGTLEVLLSALAAHRIEWVLAGAETGVELSDLLADALRLPGNGSATSIVRRNKFHMIEAVSRAGLNAPRQLRSSSLDGVLRWCEGGSWPVVIKPLHSTGTDGVAFCSNPGEVSEAFLRIHGKRNRLHLVNDEILAQSFLEGDEYVVNTVSWNGQHHVTDLWRGHKRTVAGASSIYDSEELLTRRGPEQDALARYASAALDALGVRFGPAHMEVMLTPQGPALIEMGARLQGSTNPEAVFASLGTHQVRQTVEAFVDPETFLANRTDYQVRKFARCVAMIAEQPGVLTLEPLERQLRALPSFFSLSMRAHDSQALPKTVDLFSSPGDVYLIHPDRAVLLRDLEAVRTIERTCFQRRSGMV